MVFNTYEIGSDKQEEIEGTGRRIQCTSGNNCPMIGGHFHCNKREGRRIGGSSLVCFLCEGERVETCEGWKLKVSRGLKE